MDKVIVIVAVGVLALLLLFLLFCVAAVMIKVVIREVNIKEDYEI